MNPGLKAWESLGGISYPLPNIVLKGPSLRRGLLEEDESST